MEDHQHVCTRQHKAVLAQATDLAMKIVVGSVVREMVVSLSSQDLSLVSRTHCRRLERKGDSEFACHDDCH